MDLNKLIKESHENAIEKGFYDCPECKGLKFDCTDCEFKEDECDFCQHQEKEKCPSCDGTGKDQNKNIPELLMLIISEFGEAIEALRENRHCDIEKDYLQFKYIHGGTCLDFKLFELKIKNTFEHEISDIFIQLFDLCGYLKIEIDMNKHVGSADCAENKSESLFEIVKMVVGLEPHIKAWLYDSFDVQLDIYFIDVFLQLKFLCETNNIGIEKHIIAKMEYNKTRPKKHGKEF